MNSRERRELDNYITREPDWSDEADTQADPDPFVALALIDDDMPLDLPPRPSVTPDPFPNRLTEGEGALLALDHLQHLIEQHGAATLEGAYDETGMSFRLELGGDSEYSLDLIDLIVNETEGRCREHVAGCTTHNIAELGYCALPFCHLRLAKVGK